MVLQHNLLQCLAGVGELEQGCSIIKVLNCAASFFFFSIFKIDHSRLLPLVVGVLLHESALSPALKAPKRGNYLIVLLTLSAGNGVTQLTCFVLNKQFPGFAVRTGGSVGKQRDSVQCQHVFAAASPQLGTAWGSYWD